jgi:hypothetical protein
LSQALSLNRPQPPRPHVRKLEYTEKEDENL